MIPNTKPLKTPVFSGDEKQKGSFCFTTRSLLCCQTTSGCQRQKNTFSGRSFDGRRSPEVLHCSWRDLRDGYQNFWRVWIFTHQNVYTLYQAETKMFSLHDKVDFYPDLWDGALFKHCIVYILYNGAGYRQRLQNSVRDSSGLLAEGWPPFCSPLLMFQVLVIVCQKSLSSACLVSG